MIYLKLFLSFFQIGMFSIGGGYAALPLIQEQVVDKHKWLSMAEFSDLITISQMTPGPIGINAATFVGNQIAGIGGSLISTIGCVVPSFLIVLMLAYLYNRFKKINIVQGILSGLRPAVVALIASAGITILILSLWGDHGFTMLTRVDLIATGIFLISLVVLRKWKPNQIVVMLGSGIVGMILYLITGV